MVATKAKGSREPETSCSETVRLLPDSANHEVQVVGPWESLGSRPRIHHGIVPAAPWLPKCNVQLPRPVGVDEKCVG